MTWSAHSQTDLWVCWSGQILCCLYAVLGSL